MVPATTQTYSQETLITKTWHIYVEAIQKPRNMLYVSPESMKQQMNNPIEENYNKFMTKIIKKYNKVMYSIRITRLKENLCSGMIFDQIGLNIRSTPSQKQTTSMST